MNTLSQHLWIVGDRRADRERARQALPLAEIAADCHRGLRGPYSGTGSILRLLLSQQTIACTDLLRAHQVEILSVAPELRALVDAPLETLTSLAVPKERTRFYGRGRTRRLAHGVVEFLIEYSQRRARGPLVLSLENVHAADPCEQEVIAILLRRANPEQVTVIMGTSPEELTEELATAVGRYARRIDVEPSDIPSHPQEACAKALVRAFVAADGTSDDPAEQAAYAQAEPALRALLHDARASELEQCEDWSLRLGAIPYHREHGSDPAVAGGEALMRAVDYCLDMGFYPAVLELGMRGRAVIDPDRQPDLYPKISTKVTTAAAALGQADDAEAIYIELRARYALPGVHRVSSYALAMLYTRFHGSDRKDHTLAKAYINNSIVLASQLEGRTDRAFETAFHQNGLALIEMHLGNLEVSRRLVTEGLERLNRELPPDEHQLHRSVLLHNRAQVNAALGRLEEALADFTAVIALDPNYAEYYFDRANLRRRLDDDAGALADYEHAMALSPPFHELYYNRADLRASMGDQDGALADFRYVLELEPDHLDARINRATLLLEAGDLNGALADVEYGLSLDPGNAHLVCTLGLVAMETGDAQGAHNSFTRALELDPTLHAALSNRAMVAHEQGDDKAAIEDLDQALELVGDDPDLLYNRAYLHQAAGRFETARSDYTRAMGLPGADRAELLYQRAVCLAEAGETSLYRSDLETYLALGVVPRSAEVLERLRELSNA